MPAVNCFLLFPVLQSIHNTQNRLLHNSLRFFNLPRYPSYHHLKKLDFTILINRATPFTFQNDHYKQSHKIFLTTSIKSHPGEIQERNNCIPFARQSLFLSLSPYSIARQCVSVSNARPAAMKNSSAPRLLLPRSRDPPAREREDSNACARLQLYSQPSAD